MPPAHCAVKTPENVFERVIQTLATETRPSLAFPYDPGSTRQGGPSNLPTRPSSATPQYCSVCNFG